MKQQFLRKKMPDGTKVATIKINQNHIHVMKEAKNGTNNRTSLLGIPFTTPVQISRVAKSLAARLSILEKQCLDENTAPGKTPFGACCSVHRSGSRFSACLALTCAPSS